MWAASLKSARLFVSQPPTASATQRNAVAPRATRTASISLAWSRSSIVPGSRGVVGEEREDLGVAEPAAAVQEAELDHERARDHLAAAAFHQLHGRGRRPPGGEEVV